MNGASHQARSVAAMTPAPANVCSSLRRDSELRPSILDPSRWLSLSGSCLAHNATACRGGKAANLSARPIGDREIDIGQTGAAKYMINEKARHRGNGFVRCAHDRTAH